MYSFQSTSIHVMKYISEQGTDCSITKFYQSLFFFYIDNPTFAEINKFLIFLNTCTYIINNSIIIVLNGIDLALVFGINTSSSLHNMYIFWSEKQCTWTTMILIKKKNQHNQMYKLTCTKKMSRLSDPSIMNTIHKRSSAISFESQYSSSK